MRASVALALAAFTITTQNVRVTLPPREATHDIRQAARHSSVVMTQEMKHRQAWRFRPAGWGSSHAPSMPGVRRIDRGDCATYWDRSRWHKLRAYAVPITYAPFKHGHRWALVTILRSVPRPAVRLAVVNVHMVTRTLDRRAVFARGVSRLRALVAVLRAEIGPVVVGGDWNRRYLLRARFRGLDSQRPPRGTIPNGGRIDYVFTTGRVAGVRVIGRTYSDHNGVRFRLR